MVWFIFGDEVHRFMSTALADVQRVHEISLLLRAESDKRKSDPDPPKVNTEKLNTLESRLRAYLDEWFEVVELYMGQDRLVGFPSHALAETRAGERVARRDPPSCPLGHMSPALLSECEAE